jgi:hypothetical protein
LVSLEAELSDATLARDELFPPIGNGGLPPSLGLVSAGQVV